MLNQDDFSSDEHPNFFASKEYISLHPLFSRLFGMHLCEFCFCGMRFFSHYSI